jgi:hypothetical protein
VRRLSEWLKANPFLAIALITLTIGVLGQEPAGVDYDPNPIRSTLRMIFMLIGFPFVWIGIVGSYLLPEPTTGLGMVLVTLLNLAAGLAVYVLADVARRYWRRR